MAINVTLINIPGFTRSLPLTAVELNASSVQTQQFSHFQIKNGYGNATSVSVSPGYGATVSATVDIIVDSVTEQAFNQIIQQVKKSSAYQNQSQFRQEIDSASYSSAGSVSTGIFGWLLGNGSNSYSNTSSDLTEKIKKGSSGSENDDSVVANSVANIMVTQSSKVHVTATIQVTGQLLTPSPTIIAVETTTFQFTDKNENSSSVTMLNQAPLVPVDVPSGTVSSNVLAPGAKLSVLPIE